MQTRNNRRYRLSLFLKTTAAIAIGISCFFLYSRRLGNLRKPRLRCLSIIESSVSHEGLGEFVRRNQFAFFLANRYSAQLSFPNITSSHGYAVHELFSSCRKATEKCTLHQKAMVINRCPRGDCECLWKESRQYIQEKARDCGVLSLKNDGLRTMEYSGCLRSVLKRYFAKGQKPKVPFDAIHYRAGDLKKHPGGKSLSMVEMYYVLDAMCRTSRRDIILITEGTPEIPKIKTCWKRIVLAGNTTLKEAFWIMEHAKTVSVGDSSFAIAMAEVAKPERVVVLSRSVPTYEWVNCERWTVVGERGVHFHFSSKRLMLEAVISGRPTAARSHRLEQQVVGQRLSLQVPERKWKETDFVQ